MRRPLLLFALWSTLGSAAMEATPAPWNESNGRSADTLRSDSARVLQLNHRSFLASDPDPKSGVQYAQRALELAKRIRFRAGEAQSHSHLGYCLTRLSAFDSAQAEYDRSIAIFRELKDPCSEADVLYNVGLNLQMLQQEAEALTVFMHSQELKQGCPDDHKRSVRLYAIGSVYANTQRYPQALPYYLEALSIDSATADTFRLAKEFVAIANCYGGTNDLDKALLYFDRALTCSLAIGDSLNLAYVHYNVSELEAARGNTDAAVQHAETSLRIFQRL
ncbi:MAG TPA: tetratricopeptide repeat protein, partial [Flavobacteriales bacterium]|nr:tetratricopeptide repeat protein [Flavobacteriales bacterium]